MSAWDNAVEAIRGAATVGDFEAAAYRLVAEQVLYAADRGSKVAYSLVRDFERDFRRVLEPLGVGLRVNSQLRYACALPLHAKLSTASVDQTLLALVLRKIYDEAARAGQHNEHGEVACDLVDLEMRYRQATGGRELSTGGRLQALLQSLRRWGIARTEDEGVGLGEAGVEQPFMVVIRPGIADVLGEAALERLALFSSTDSVGPGAGDGSADGTDADADADADVDANATAQEEP